MPAAGRWGWRERGAAAAPDHVPGTLYDGDGTLLAGSGPELTLETTEALPHKALIHGKPGAVDIAVLEAGDWLWVLPDSFGTPPVSPVLLLTELAHVVRQGRKVGLAANRHDAYVLARDALCCHLMAVAGGREAARARPRRDGARTS